VRNDIFRARAGLRLEQNQADERDREGRAVGVGRREKIVALCGRRPTCGAVCPAAPEPVAGTPGLQRADATPELVARTMGPQVVLDRARSLLRVAARRASAASGGKRSAASETSSGGPQRMDREGEERVEKIKRLLTVTDGSNVEILQEF
jgi:hypothetical protein